MLKLVRILRVIDRGNGWWDAIVEVGKTLVEGWIDLYVDGQLVEKHWNVWDNDKMAHLVPSTAYIWFQSPSPKFTEVKAIVYNADGSVFGSDVWRMSPYAQINVRIVSEDSTVDISGYTATIHGKVTIESDADTIVYPAVVYMGGKILLDPIKIYKGTRTYTYTRTFNFKSVYELLRRRGETTDAYIWYYKSDKTTKIQGDTTKFKLEPTGVITPKAVVKITVDKTQIMRGESITGTATIEKVEGIKLPTTATLCLDGEAYLKDGRKPGFGTAPFFSQTISSVPVSTKFSFNPTRVRGLENAVKVDLRVRAVIGGYEFKSNTVTITIVEPKVTSWSVKADKTTVKPGDKLTIQATVNWVGKSMKFKLGIDAFGKHYESTEVTATASPATIKVPITVPAVKEGTYEIKVKLYYEEVV